MCAAGCALGEKLLIRAPGAFGKATTMPGLSPTPPSSSVPWVETWCGLALQCAAGTQLTLWIFTLSTCREGLAAALAPAPVRPVDELGALVVEVPPAFAVEVTLGAEAPPAPTASAVGAYVASARSDATMAVARTNLDRLWAPVLAKTWTLLRAEPARAGSGSNTCPDRRPPTLSAMSSQTEWWHGSCACAVPARPCGGPSPSGSRSRSAPAVAGWTAGRAAHRAG